MPWEWTKRVAIAVNERKVTLSFWAVVAVATIVVSFLAYQIHEGRRLSESTRDLARENLVRLDENAETRRQLVRAFQKSNQHLCLEVEKLKQGFRQQAIDDYNDLDKNLATIHIKVTPELRQVALDARNKTLKKYEASKDGCPLSPTG